MPVEVPKPKCPECKTEIVLTEGKLPEKCASCGFLVREYQPFERMMNAYVKALKEAAKANKEEADPLPSFLRGLRG